ncbi:MAG TPA: hypothetical protein VHB25_08025 [Gemmatimonadaceae bacterium]|nr:hypothetical protein [Gemmatimonadaceae bacterium]
MSKPSEPRDPSDARDDLIRELLEREGVHLDGNVKAHVNVNVTTRRVRVNPDGTRTVISETTESRPATGSTLRASGRGTSARRKWIILAMIGVGAAQASYGAWSGWSDEKMAPVYHASPSCQTQWLDAAANATGRTPADGDACRVESVMISRKHWYSGRQTTTYYLETVRADGHRDDTPMAWRTGNAFWQRVRPTERILVQRFVAPGYHLTGAIMAFADAAGRGMSRDNPDSGTHYPSMNMFLGGAIALTGLLLLVRLQRQS